MGEQHRWARSDGLKAIVKCAGEWRDAAAAERRREGGCLRTHWRAQTGRERIFLDETGVTSLRVHDRCVKCTNKSYKCRIYVTSRSKESAECPWMTGSLANMCPHGKGSLKLKPRLMSIVFLDNKWGKKLNKLQLPRTWFLVCSLKSKGPSTNYEY